MPLCDDAISEATIRVGNYWIAPSIDEFSNVRK